jgi:hypothetical protein
VMMAVFSIVERDEIGVFILGYIDQDSMSLRSSKKP